MKNLYFKSAKLISVLWPLGFSPFAPGTIASLFSAYLGYLINIYFGSLFTLALAIFSGIVGFWATKVYLEKNNQKDPREVVIDEFSGQLIVTSVAGISPFLNILAFCLFRFFDILKPGIIGKSEKLKGATGIMMDDWLSGLLSAVILFILIFFGF